MCEELAAREACGVAAWELSDDELDSFKKVQVLYKKGRNKLSNSCRGFIGGQENIDHLNAMEVSSQKDVVSCLSKKGDFVSIDDTQMPDWAENSSGKKSSHGLMGNALHQVLNQLKSLGSPDAPLGSLSRRDVSSAHLVGPTSKQVTEQKSSNINRVIPNKTMNRIPRVRYQKQTVSPSKVPTPVPRPQKGEKRMIGDANQGMRKNCKITSYHLLRLSGAFSLCTNSLQSKDGDEEDAIVNIPDDEVVRDMFTVRDQARTNCSSGPQKTNDYAAQQGSYPLHQSETHQTLGTVTSTTSSVLGMRSDASVKECSGMDAQKAFLSSIKPASKPAGSATWNSGKNKANREGNSGLTQRMQQIMNSERKVLENFKTMGVERRQGLHHVELTVMETWWEGHLACAVCQVIGRTDPQSEFPKQIQALFHSKSCEVEISVDRKIRVHPPWTRITRHGLDTLICSLVSDV